MLPKSRCDGELSKFLKQKRKRTDFKEMVEFFPELRKGQVLTHSWEL